MDEQDLAALEAASLAEATGAGDQGQVQPEHERIQAALAEQSGETVATSSSPQPEASDPIIHTLSDPQGTPPQEPASTEPALVYPVRGFDCYAGVLPQVMLAKAAAFGCKFVIHYYGGSSHKDLTKQSAIETTNNGMLVGAVWESAGDNPESFSSETGTENARAALSFAEHVGQPKGSAIYFAVDFGPTLVQLTNNVLPYLAAAKLVLAAAGYKLGVYGAGDVLAAAMKAGVADYDWLGGAMGWPGSRAYQNPALAQGLPSDPFSLGMQVDPDVMHREAGLFRVTV